MNLQRVWRIMAKDLRLGPRSPVFLYVVIMPVVITFMLQVVLLTLLQPAPRLGVVDHGESVISSALQDLEGIRFRAVASEAELHRLVIGHDLDAGLVLAPNFDAALRGGERPDLALTFSGESRAANRLLLTFAALDQVRAVEGRPAPVTVAMRHPGGGESITMAQRLLPSVLMFVLIGIGIFNPAFMLIQERERQTLAALLVTPLTVGELLLAKATLGFGMVIAMSFLTLALNSALTSNPLALLVVIAVAAAVCVEIGLIYGSMVKDAKTLYTLVKSLNVFLVGPVIFYLFPNWPQWIAKLFPTYWIIDPIYQVSLRGVSLTEVGSELLIGLAIGGLLLVPVVLLSRRLVTAD